MSDFTVYGEIVADEIDFNGVATPRCSFHDVTLTGAYVPPNSEDECVQSKTCRLKDLTDFCGVSHYDSIFVGTITPASNKELTVVGASSGVPGLGRPTIDLTGKVAVKFGLRDYKGGGLTFQGCEDANNEVTIHGEGMRLRLLDCTAGTISVRGKGDLEIAGTTQAAIDSNSLTLDLSAWIESGAAAAAQQVVMSDVGQIRDILEGDQEHDSVNDKFRIKHKDTKTTLVEKDVTGGNLDGDITLTES
jgi:hypothetical protein